MNTSELRYAAGDVEAVGYLVSPAGARAWPGILLAPEGPGLGAHARLRAEMLAGLGYVALAIDLHGNGHVAPTHEETIARVTHLGAHRGVLRARVAAGLAALRACSGVDGGRVAAVGYCFGGLAVLELARSGAELAAVVTFHGLLTAADPGEARNIKASILVCTGADDDLVPPAQVAAFEDEMRSADVDWQVIKYGGARHAFTNRVDAEALAKIGFGYDSRADARSWDAMRAFLEETLNRPAAPGAAGAAG